MNEQSRASKAKPTLSLKENKAYKFGVMWHPHNISCWQQTEVDYFKKNRNLLRHDNFILSPSCRFTQTVIPCQMHCDIICDEMST